MKLAGLDIGTTGCKCTVFDESGKLLGKAYRDYPVVRKTSGHEIDILGMMDGVYAVISEMSEKYPDIAGIGITSFGETFIFTDENGTPLHSAMLYTDPRGEEECNYLIDKMGKYILSKNADYSDNIKNAGKRCIAHISGLEPHQMYSISKMMWIKNHMPDIYSKAKYAFLMGDYVTYHLTGQRKIDYSLATRTMAFDITNLCWSSDIFEAAGIDMNLMSDAVPTGSIAGNVTKEAAEKTGLSLDTKIVIISHDQVAAVTGAGAFDGSHGVDGAGTVECMIPVFDEKPDIDVMRSGYFSVVPYIIKGKYVTYAFSYTGGALIQWCLDTLAGNEKAKAEKLGISVNEYLENEYLEMYGDEPSGMLVLPHFAGAATPYMDTESKGAILGLTTATSVAQIYRACMEGVVYEMCIYKKFLSGSGMKFNKLNATGGGAHSKTWMQMKADMLNCPITALETVDAGTVGCAMLTGVAVGAFKSLEEAAEHMVIETVTYEPRPDMHDKYMKIFERYEKLYDAVRPLV